MAQDFQNKTVSGYILNTRKNNSKFQENSILRNDDYNMDKRFDNETGCYTLRIVGFSWVLIQSVNKTPINLKAEPDHWNFDIPKQVGAYSLGGLVPIISLVYIIYNFNRYIEKEIKDLIMRGDTQESILSRLNFISSSVVRKVFSQNDE